MKNTIKKWGFYLAGFANIAGILLFSMCFTNQSLNQADPEVMSNFGLLLIIVWGLAYIAVAHLDSIRWLAGVFVVEKLIYVVNWVQWHDANSLSSLYAQDKLAGVFYAIYGPNDFVFMLFFAWIFLCYRCKK